MPSAVNADISHLVNTLNLRKGGSGTVLIIGSRAGGLFRSKKFYETLMKFGEPSFQELPRIRQFERCYNMLTRKAQSIFSISDINLILTEALKEVDVTYADICLAELVSLGLFNIIITTNVDNILEDALEWVGLKEMHHFEVFNLLANVGKEQLPFEKNNIICHIIKVFGQLTTREYEIRRSGYFSRHPDIKESLKEILTRDIIAIGMDQKWDAELYSAFQTPGDSFWFINEEAPDEDTDFFHIGEARNCKYVVGEEGVYQNFIQKMNEAILDALPMKKSDSYNVNGSILKELHKLKYEIRQLREEIRNYYKLS